MGQKINDAATVETVARRVSNANDYDLMVILSNGGLRVRLTGEDVDEGIFLPHDDAVFGLIATLQKFIDDGSLDKGS